MSFTIIYLYEKYRADIYYYILSLTHNKSVTEDLTSDVFVSAIQSLPNFKGECDIKTWLFSIARNKWCEFIRKDKKNNDIYERLQFYIDDKIWSVEKNYSNKEIINRISKLLEDEPEKTRTILLMRVDGYSYYEIGKKVNISESSARVIDFRVRHKLKDILTKEGFCIE